MARKPIVVEGVEFTHAYCRRCRRNLSKDNFFMAVDLNYIDTNGLMSVCKDCCNAIFDEQFARTNNMEKALHNTCRMLNMRYSDRALEATKLHIQTMIDNGTNPSPFFSTYKIKLMTSMKGSMDKSVPEDMTYEDVSTVYVSRSLDPNAPVVPQELRDFWGDGYKFDDIQYLEREYANFKRTHKSDTYAEIVLLKEVCVKLFEIKQNRDQGKNTSNQIKELQELMKSLAISPNALSSSGNGKESESFGLWIQDIERTEPAEWLEEEGHDMYRDVGNVEKYFNDYIVRPLRNLITQSKDFNVDEEVIDDDDGLLGEE